MEGRKQVDSLDRQVRALSAQQILVKPRLLSCCCNKQVAAALHERKPLPAVPVSPVKIVKT